VTVELKAGDHLENIQQIVMTFKELFIAPNKSLQPLLKYLKFSGAACSVNCN
jgi:hypothetical protein